MSTDSNNTKVLDILDFCIKLFMLYIVNMNDKIINKKIYIELSDDIDYSPVELITEYIMTETYLTNISMKDPIIYYGVVFISYIEVVSYFA